MAAQQIAVNTDRGSSLKVQNSDIATDVRIEIWRPTMAPQQQGRHLHRVPSPGPEECSISRWGVTRARKSRRAHFGRLRVMRSPRQEPPGNSGLGVVGGSQSRVPPLPLFFISVDSKGS